MPLGLGAAAQQMPASPLKAASRAASDPPPGSQQPAGAGDTPASGAGGAAAADVAAEQQNSPSASSTCRPAVSSGSGSLASCIAEDAGAGSQSEEPTSGLAELYCSSEGRSPPHEAAASRAVVQQGSSVPQPSSPPPQPPGSQAGARLLASTPAPQPHSQLQEPGGLGHREGSLPAGGPEVCLFPRQKCQCAGGPHCMFRVSLPCGAVGGWLQLMASSARQYLTKLQQKPAGSFIVHRIASRPF
jgi:hypothetical protein